MVLHSGVIIPFQYRDTKKLLMIGSPEENRELNVWDFKNAVRDAFGIYEFDFRNKKIGFHIPEKFLLYYLTQRQDLTNFVIEVEQVLVKSNESSKVLHSENINMVPPNHSYSYEGNNTMDYSTIREESTTSPRHLPETYANTQTPELLTHAMNPLDIKADASDARYESKLDNQQSTNYPSYSDSMLDGPGLDSQYSAATLNKFRKRGERISRDQKELYVKYLEDNPCMVTQRLNDSLLEPHWKKLADIMNSVPQGAMKSVEEWKNTFYTWRYRVFMLVRHNTKLAGTAARNPKNFKQITAIDQRAYALWTSHKSVMQQAFNKVDLKSNFNY